MYAVILLLQSIGSAAEDTDLANNVTLLSNTSKLGLTISKEKSEVMRVSELNNSEFKKNDKDLVEVNQFTYVESIVKKRLRNNPGY